jgi:hypothetical protein
MGGRSPVYWYSNRVAIVKIPEDSFDTLLIKFEVVVVCTSMHRGRQWDVVVVVVVVVVRVVKSRTRYAESQVLVLMAGLKLGVKSRTRCSHLSNIPIGVFHSQHFLPPFFSPACL